MTAGPAAADQPAKTWPDNAYWYAYLGLQKAWKVSQGQGVTVAVIDDGVQADVGDLQGQVLVGHDLTNPSGDGRTGHPAPDGLSHGTTMAELIAGTGRGAGMVGVAPMAKILPVTICTSSSIDVDPDWCQRPNDVDQQIPDGIRWAVDHGADIVNISQAGPGTKNCSADLPRMQAALTYAYAHGVLVLAGTGNTGAIREVAAPADCPGAIAVGAENGGFIPWPEEQSGPELDFVAPGVQMPTPAMRATRGQAWTPSSGTSNATALVSGVFALVKSKYPHDSARDLVTRVLWTVHNGPTVDGFAKRVNDKLGYGTPLPYFALTQHVDLKAANPIYDKIDASMASHRSSSTPSTPASSGPTTHPDSGSSSDDSSSHTGLVVALLVGLVVLIFVLVVVVLLVVRANNKNRPRGPMPPMPPPPPYRP